MAEHTEGAVKAAQIIMAGQPGSLIDTKWGPKTVEGLADLIDNLTAKNQIRKKPTILVTIEGGCLLSVFCTQPAGVKLIDYDNADKGPSSKVLEKGAAHLIRSLKMIEVW